jgi:hypothetical protein
LTCNFVWPGYDERKYGDHLVFVSGDTRSQIGAQTMSATAVKRPKTDPKKVKIVGVRVTREYQAWLDKLAAADRSSLSDLFDRAMMSHAKAIGFTVPAPERVP